jgi:hypothetical protein
MSKKNLPSLLTAIAGAIGVSGPELRSIDGLGGLDACQRFVRRLQGMSPDEQANLLRIEHDEEVLALKESALADQYFEVAAACIAELKRRAGEQNVSSPNS